MIVCLCQQVRESDIARSVEQGAQDFSDVQTITGAGTCCGQCSEFAQELSHSLISAKQFHNAA